LKIGWHESVNPMAWLNLEFQALPVPILPLDHIEPFAATLGIMHYPGTDDADRRHAAAFTSKFLASVMADDRRAAGLIARPDLVELCTAARFELADLDLRKRGAQAAGEVFKVYYALSVSDPARASWSTAQRIVTIDAAKNRQRAGDTYLKAERGRFGPVLHLWGALAIRDYSFKTDPSVSYDGVADFHSFLAESEALLEFGKTWNPKGAKSARPLADIDMWRPPASWAPPARQKDWPETGKLPVLGLSDEFIRSVTARIRPRKKST
jgi:hypothetical protein